MKTSRRDFLGGVSTIAVSSLLPIVTLDKAEAWIHGSGSQLFNSGKTQLNMGTVLGGGLYPFTNVLLNNQGWNYVNIGANSDPTTLDANGYPTSYPGTGRLATLYNQPTQASRPGNYTVTFQATASGQSIGIGGVGTFTSTAAGLNTFNAPAANWLNAESTTFTVLGFQTVSSPVVQINSVGVTDIHIFHVNDASAHAAALAKGQSWGGFSPLMMSQLRAMKPGVIRFLDFQGRQAWNWADRAPVTANSFSAYCPPGIVCGTTGGTGDTFTITGNGIRVPSSGPPTDKMTMIMTCNHAGTTSANTINLNGTGAVPVYSIGAQGVGCQPRALFNGPCFLMYDAPLNAWLFNPGHQAGNFPGFPCGVPPEICARLCYEVGAHPWFVTPAYGFNPLSDVMINIATYVKTTYQDSGLAPWMVPRYEGPNEAWNGNSEPAQYYGVAVAQKWWQYEGGAGDDHYYGNGISLLGQAINALYGSPNPKTQTKYELVCGVQSALAVGQGTSFSSPRLTSVRTPGGYLTPAYTSGSPNITVSGSGLTLSVNDPVQLTCEPAGNIPSGFTKETTYFVKTIVGSVITIAATMGGTAISPSSVGSGVQVLVKATGSAAYNWATTVACTNYINPQSNFAVEFMLACDTLANPGNQTANLLSYTNSANVQTWRGNLTIVGTTLTVNSTTFGSIAWSNSNDGGVLLGSGIAYNTRVLSGTGPYTVNISQNVGPVSATQEGLLVAEQAWQAWGASFANPVTKLSPYEGGWSPDFASALSTDCLVACASASVATQCKLSYPASGIKFLYLGGVSVPPPTSFPPNSTIFTGFADPLWTSLNGIYPIVSMDATGVTIALDTSGQAAPCTSFDTTNASGIPANKFELYGGKGTVSCDGAGTMTVTGYTGLAIVPGCNVSDAFQNFSLPNGFPKVISQLSGTAGGNGTYSVSGLPTKSSVAGVLFWMDPWWPVNKFRYASKFAVGLGPMLTQNYDDVRLNCTGGQFPSAYVYGTTGIWGFVDPDLYNAAASPQYQAIVQYNS